jgi:hypothetical protein
MCLNLALTIATPDITAPWKGSIKTTRPSCRDTRMHVQQCQHILSVKMCLQLALTNGMPEITAPWKGSMNTTRPSCRETHMHVQECQHMLSVAMSLHFGPAGQLCGSSLTIITPGPAGPDSIAPRYSCMVFMLPLQGAVIADVGNGCNLRCTC